MIRSLRFISATAMLLVSALLFTSCEGAFDDIFGEWDKPGSVTSISLTKTTLSLVVGEADVTLTYTIEPANATDNTVTWSSDNTAVATVDATGRVHAVAVGTAIITAKAGDKSATCTVTVTEVYAANEYNEGAWDGTKVIFTKQTAAADPTALTNSVTSWSGWYTVSGEVTITGNVTLGADTHLILCDGAKLTINGFLYGSDMYKLHIYGQANQSGQLVVNCSTSAAILSITTLEVHSCKVTATSSHDCDAGLYYIGTFNVYGGSIDAESTTTGTDAGYGISLKNNGSMNIYGGDVKAVGKKAYGIRTEGSPATFTVYGGQLWAECAENMALDDHVTLAKGDGFTGKIETSDDGSSWTEYTSAGTPSTRYVRVGY